MAVGSSSRSRASGCRRRARAAWPRCARSRGRGGRCDRPSVSPSATRPAMHEARPRRAGRSPSPCAPDSCSHAAGRPRCCRRRRCRAPRRSSSLHVHEAVLEDRLGDHRRAVGDAVERHELRLHVGRERRVLRGADVTARGRAVARARGSSRRRRRSSTPASRSLSITASRWSARALAQQRRRRRSAATAHRKVPASMRSGMIACVDAVQALDALDRRCGSVPAPSMLRAHRDRALGEVDDLGLARRVLEHRLAVGQRRRHQQVLGAGDGDHVGRDARALQPLGARRSM